MSLTNPFDLLLAIIWQNATTECRPRRSSITCTSSARSMAEQRRRFFPTPKSCRPSMSTIWRPHAGSHRCSAQIRKCMGAGPDGRGPGRTALLTLDEVLNLSAEGALLLPQEGRPVLTRKVPYTPTENLRVRSNRPLPEHNRQILPTGHAGGRTDRSLPACLQPFPASFPRLSGVPYVFDCLQPAPANPSPSTP